MCHLNQCDKPHAAPGLTSYRAMSAYGWIMIGAESPQDALQTASRLTRYPHSLQVWNGHSYVPCEPLGA